MNLVASQNQLNAVLEIKIGLTEKYRNVAVLVTMGLSNKEIANQLFITEANVKSRLCFIYEKMNLKSRAQLIVWCLPYLSNDYNDVISKFNEKTKGA